MRRTSKGGNRVSDIALHKAAARKAAESVRAEAHARGQGTAAERLAAALAPFAGLVLAGYMPMRSEIDPLPAMSAHSGPVSVPVILGRGQPLGFRAWAPGAAMQRGQFGALIPVAGAWLTPRVLVVPLLAFDARGYRLGYGGGFYDRTLAELRARGPVTAIGFAFGAQQVHEVPTEATDEKLDLVVTEADTFGPF
ncbi:MAG: 5-formyltetrahydrofolate cyclo-ligase [Rhodobacteraceae bacterium]|nr:5-formyltetrahydrofolate cyclo-ligase [Paracoccaceae bacterium]